MSAMAAFITEPVVFSGSADGTSDPLVVKIPGRQGHIRAMIVDIPTGNSGITADVVYADNTDADLSDLDTLDPMETRIFVSGIAYAGTSNPAGPKAATYVPDAQYEFGDRAAFKAPDQDDHRIAIRVAGSTQDFSVRVQLICDIWR